MSTSRSEPAGILPASFTTPGSSSFTEFAFAYDPRLLPSSALASHGPAGVATAASVPHATTIVALRYRDGVVMAGDRRATMGNIIAHHEMEKVYPADDYSCIGIAGSAGIAVEMVRLFQVELEHYEKIEGALLSLDGKANRLASMIRGNLGLAFQGLAVVPLFAGYDIDRTVGRLFSYDITGGRYEEHEYHSVGSGSLFAKGTLKRSWRAELAGDEAVRIAVAALIDAADDDSATGGPDEHRNIYPVVAEVSSAGYRRIGDDQIRAEVNAIRHDNTNRRNPSTDPTR